MLCGPNRRQPPAKEARMGKKRSMPDVLWERASLIPQTSDIRRRCCRLDLNRYTFLVMVAAGLVISFNTTSNVAGCRESADLNLATSHFSAGHSSFPECELAMVIL